MMNDFFSIVEVEINSDCNRTCSYCPNAEYQRKSHGEMSETVFLTLLKQLKEINFSGRFSYHFYGEPLLCSSLEHYVALTKEFLPKTRRILYSNGDFLTNTRIEELVDTGIDGFIITKHEGEENNFEQVLNNLTVNLQSKITYLNHKELNITNRGGKLAQISDHQSYSIPCFIPSLMLIVTLTGNVLPCCEDYDETVVMGNIMNAHIKDIWNSSAYSKLRKELENGNRNYLKICNICNNFSVQKKEQFDYVL